MTRDRDAIDACIDRAAESVGSAWPLHSFVTANPLSGFEDRPFHRAAAEAERLFDARGYPHPSVFRRAWADGRIDPAKLTAGLEAHGVTDDPEAVLDRMAAAESARRSDGDADVGPATETVDRVLSKWLATFLDEGAAELPMPGREDGFYAAWRRLAPHDGDVPDCRDPSDLPESPMAALEAALRDRPRDRWEAIFEHHLAALPGWTGFIKRRAADDGDPWQSSHPISLREYLAVRLVLADLLGAPTDPGDGADETARVDPTADDGVPLPEIWVTAWEESYRDRLLANVDLTAATADASADDGRPAAQLAFCIDARSEVVRRHVEAAGPYETHGYAGFFGVPMRHSPYESDVEVDACPPVVDAQHRIAEHPRDEDRGKRETHDGWTGLVRAGRKHLKSLKTDVAAAFSFVEGAGSAYGAVMTARTLSPATVGRLSDAVGDRLPSPAEFCEPAVDRSNAPDADGDLPTGMRLEEKVEYAETAFDLMGWEEFAGLVVFVGHASDTTNNPFASSLDCGACAGNPGGPNARVLAAICNDDDVRSALGDRGVDVPSDTVFLAGEHDTTTDEVTLFDGDVPESHREDLERLREDLDRARTAAATERAESMTTDAPADGVSETERRAADWAETRPEWGLAGNASLVVGPRELTAGRDLGGRAFLHSYDWRTDPDGDALEAIVTGPLVVTQWINSQYYFATVDNAVFGSGSKVTQNPRGNVGVVQGNGGDLMTGLPRQSLMADHERPYHQPIRLTAVIQAPVERVTEVLRRNDAVARLFDNGWLSLTVLNPEQGNEAYHYEGDLEWEPNAVPALVN